MFFRAILILFLSLRYSAISFADNREPHSFDLDLSDESTVSITQFGEDGDRVLWIPSEYGINKEKHENLLTALTRFKHEVWLAKLHESYFISPGRSSYTQIPVNEISELIEKSLPEGNRKLFIVSTGRGAALSLLAINGWQSETGSSEKFGGIIMIHPNFQADTPIPGTTIQYLSIVDKTQLPIFIIQPKKSNKYWYLNDLVTRLSNGGSQVYTQVIEDVSDGYHVRPNASEIENQVDKQLPRQISRAIHLLSQTIVETGTSQKTIEPWEITAIPDTLQPYPGTPFAPSLELEDTNGKDYALDDHPGKVIVLNFWATWCPPCVEEIPSLGRLQQAFSKDDLVVLSVDIGESKKEVETFLKKVPADFPVLLDTEGSTVKQWKIVAFPTTFIINQQGMIELAYYGGLEWDKPDVINQLQDLIKP